MDGRDPTYLSVREAADRMRVSRQTVIQLIARGGLPAARVGGQYRIARESVERLLAPAHRQGDNDD